MKLSTSHGGKLSYASAQSLSSECYDYEEEEGGQTESNESFISKDSAGITELKSVNKWKLLVSMSFIAAASFIVVATHTSLSADEKNEFETTFNHLGSIVNGTAHVQVRSIIESYQSMADKITSHALASAPSKADSTATNHNGWPFITIPNVEVHFQHLRHETFTKFISFSPIIQERGKQMWENYSVKNQHWIQESQSYSLVHTQTSALLNNDTNSVEKYPMIPTEIHFMENKNDDDDVAFVEDKSWGPYAPIWQMSPPPDSNDDLSLANYNILSDSFYVDLLQVTQLTQQSVLSRIIDNNNEVAKAINIDYQVLENDLEEKGRSPHSIIMQPIYDSYNIENRRLVGLLEGIFSWDLYFMDLLPFNNDVDSIMAVVTNSCNESFTYKIHGHKAQYLGMGDSHDDESDYDGDENYIEVDFIEFDDHNNLINETGAQCHYKMYLYPSLSYQKHYNTIRPELYTVAVAIVFLTTGILFCMLNHCVTRHQKKLMLTAEKTNTVVSALFPKSVRDRVMKDVEEQVQKGMMDGGNQQDHRSSNFFKEAPKLKLKSYLNDEEGQKNHDDCVEGDFFNTKPIADFFPAVTVLFADIVGFTAWSSVREPHQVFQLLETIYYSFDTLAKRRRVFKVETVGDCYVAATGLPDPRNDHALLMARFARECLESVHELTRKLEETLGPDTGELTMRFGLHSGPVTAGVLRGEKSRFQLFGDTMNTASRIETTGLKDHIHISQETADLLVASGKSKWIIPRENKVLLKGIGQVQTFWLSVSGERSNSMGSSNSGGAEEFVESHPSIVSNKKDQPQSLQSSPRPIPNNKNDDGDNDDNHVVLDPKMERLVKWNVDQLIKLLKPVIASRNCLKRRSNQATTSVQRDSDEVNPDAIRKEKGYATATVLEEVKEIIELPKFDAKHFKSIENPDMIELSTAAADQLHDYVRNICTLYRGKNPFHNFEHASHVTMSVCKLLSRITAPEEVHYNTDEGDDFSSPNDSSGRGNFAAALHDHTYGITSDPLTQFAVAFSALIHDVDHSGVPNTQLITENTVIASLYKNKSVAEQNSVDLSWNLLMDDKYADLRNVLFSNDSEYVRFRQLTVNSVMATDIVDKELKELRNSRWEKAFSMDGIELKTQQDLEDDRNRKATIVIEHLIQASDVAHTMQHWHIYRKWNERFFREMYLAYKTGRSEKDPSEMWYKGEIGFFDFYIIPLARKLKDCGVFGVSSDECLNFALMNRAEWVGKGESVVEDMLENFKKEYGEL